MADSMLAPARSAADIVAFSGGRWRLAASWLRAFQGTIILISMRKKVSEYVRANAGHGLLPHASTTPEKEDFTRNRGITPFPRPIRFAGTFLRNHRAENFLMRLRGDGDIVELLNHGICGCAGSFWQGSGKSDRLVHFTRRFCGLRSEVARVRGFYYTPEPWSVTSCVRLTICETRFTARSLADENTLILDPPPARRRFFICHRTDHQKFVKQKGAWDGLCGEKSAERVSGF